MKIHSTALLFVTTSISLTLAPAMTAPAAAETMPAVKASGQNSVPECATPGRLMAFVAARNGNLDDRFSNIATSYMSNGEELGIRWDYAFFQMMLETGNLSFKQGNGKAGAVRATQNNFAGLGATGGSEHGESFKDVDSGVKAHLQHLLMYSGEHVDAPVAERTRKVQEWGVLTSWQKGFKRPVTFEDLAQKWAPGSHAYSRDIQSVASHFYSDFCNKADPNPKLLQEARAGRAVGEQKSAGVKLARKANERARAEGDGTRTSLGAALPEAGADAPTRSVVTSGSTTGVKLINETPATEAEAASVAPASNAPVASAKTAAAAASAKTAAVTAPATPAPKPSATAKCRVWTASYGGQKSVIIQSSSDQMTNFTVLDVNDGQEARETDAYIAAYAKGGKKIADFPSQSSAMDKAFQLCPEG